MGKCLKLTGLKFEELSESFVVPSHEFFKLWGLRFWVNVGENGSGFLHSGRVNRVAFGVLKKD